MSLRATLVILVVAVVLALCQALPIEDNNLAADYGTLDNFFYLSPRLRRDPLSFGGQNAYLHQLLQNLKPKFRRSVW
ncbi:hypothetical protein Y032_0002g1066 [Ancylostoma ceylanicum]|uniref:Uncharacterized protein n=2 Tax=Ancylostoma TaxID=29169 RepID=A0A016W139_9BILA|nr:hypothetical protein Y032_0002g1066 [Ancylostoma ceylanicum]RCN47558.1 hypothetical protein ANCCAN_06329 [Ancylostoma caninum]